MSFTLSTLKSTVQDYVESTETTFTSNLDTFIKEAEDRIFNNVQLPVQRKNVQGALTASNRFLATPTDFYAPFSVAVIANDKYHYLTLNIQALLRNTALQLLLLGVLNITACWMTRLLK